MSHPDPHYGYGDRVMIVIDSRVMCDDDYVVDMEWHTDRPSVDRDGRTFLSSGWNYRTQFSGKLWVLERDLRRKPEPDALVTSKGALHDGQA